MQFLRRFRAPKPTFSAPLAPDEPFFAIGDIHGQANLLSRLIDKLDALNLGAPRVFVGDYIDRGEQSARVLTMLQEYQADRPDQVICLIGNHEDMLLSFMDAPALHGSRWLRYGGLQTIASYSITPPQSEADEAGWDDCRDRLLAAMGEETLAWIRNLRTWWQSGNVVTLHAGADPALPMQAQDSHHLLWGHPDFEKILRQDGLWIAHGHTIVDEPRVRNGRIATDTGAYATGRLTAALIQPGATEFLTA